MPIRSPRSWAAGLLALCLPPAACAATAYRVEAFGDMGAVGVSINQAGVVVGNANQGGFIYQDGVLQLLGSFGGSGQAVVHGINDQGVIVGARSGSSGQDEAFVSDHGTVNVIAGMTGAQGINNAGMVYGLSGTYAHPVVWTGSELRAIASGNSTDQFEANAINAAGQVVGQRLNTGAHDAYVWDRGTMTFISLPGDSYASDINDLGQVVGWNCAAGVSSCRGYRYTGGVAQLIAPPAGLVNSWFEAINNQGDILGYGYTASGAVVPFLLGGAGYTLLNDVLDQQAVADGWQLFAIDDYNDAGRIVGRATRNGLFYYSVLLTPYAAAVPEPAAWQLGLLASLLWPVAGRMARRQDTSFHSTGP